MRKSSLLIAHYSPASLPSHASPVPDRYVFLATVNHFDTVNLPQSVFEVVFSPSPAVFPGRLQSLLLLPAV